MTKEAESIPPEERPPEIPGYEIIELIGSGGQGSVYLAQQVSLRRNVAIKILDADTSRDPKLARNFVREARLASQFHHPNILQAIDVGKTEGRLYFVMEYIAGPDTHSVREEHGALKEVEVIKIGQQVASALQYTAGQGIYHGDIKPENLVITEDDTVKVVDFGIAGLLRSKEKAASGTMGFMAPELLKGRPVGPGSDLFSLGVTMFELLTGDLPQGPDDVGNHAISPRFAAILKRLLQRSPKARYDDAGELIADLDDALERITTGRSSTPQRPGAASVGAPNVVPVSGRRRRKARGVDATTIVLTVLVLGTVAWLLRDSDVKGVFRDDDNTSETSTENAKGPSDESKPQERAGAPSVTASLRIESPTDSTTVGGDGIVIRGSLTEADGAALFIDDQPVRVTDGRFEHIWNPNAGGAQTVRCVVRAGEAVVDSKKITLMVDDAPPELVILQPEGSVVTTAKPQIAGSLTDMSRSTLTLNGRALPIAEDGTWSTTINLKESSQPLALIAKDAFGNVSQETLELKLDDSPPTLRVSDIPKRLSAESLPVDISVDDDTGVGSVFVNDQEARYADGRWRGVASLAKEGQNEIVVRAVDLAGNEATHRAVVEVDRTPPVLKTEAPVIECTSGRPVHLRGYVDDLGARVAVAGKPVSLDAEGRWEVEVPSPRAPLTYEVTAVDEYGNSSAPLTIEVYLLSKELLTRRKRLKKVDRKVRGAIDNALDWLVRHQSPDGSWDADEFMQNGDEGLGELCTGPASYACDIGVTGLALLAFLGDGHTHSSGEHRLTVSKGLNWLLSQQDPIGKFGDDQRNSHSFSYEHALATLTLAESLSLTKSPRFKKPAQAAVGVIAARQNPYKAWRYGERTGENDTSITGWMVQALWSARAAGLEIPENSLPWALAWVQDMTDEETGRTGYGSRGAPPVRDETMTERFPAELSESVTAIGILIRMLCGENPKKSPVIRAGLELLMKKQPSMNIDGAIDMYYWYYATTALFHVGGKDWKKWRTSLKSALLPAQRREGNAAGSWDPTGAWGSSGGRVYSTAIATLALQTEYRQGDIKP